MQTLRLYTFGSTRKTDGHLSSYGYNRETTRSQSEIVGTPHGHRTGPGRFPLKVYLRTVLTQNIEESQSKKSYDACMS